MQKIDYGGLFFQKLSILVLGINIFKKSIFDIINTSYHYHYQYQIQTSPHLRLHYELRATNVGG